MKSLLVFLLLAVRLLAGGPYYIDFLAANDSANGTTSSTPWKRCPGMTGFTGTYTHAVGDIFYFKNGVTWTSAVFPWTIANSGSAGNVDTYTTLNGFGSGAQPILDGQATHPVGGMVHATSKQYFLINDLNIINQDAAGAAPTSNAEQMMVFDSCQHYTVQNCTLTPECKTCVYVNESSGSTGTYTDHNFLYNTISHAGSFSWITTAAANFNLTAVNIIGNSLFDGYTQMYHGIHCDGLVHFFGSGGGAGSPFETITASVIANNKVYGNWTIGDVGQGSGITAFIYSESNFGGLVYNNSFQVTPQADGQIVDWIVIGAGAGQTLGVYNNTVLSTQSGNLNGRLFQTAAEAGSVVTVQNNIFTGNFYATDSVIVSTGVVNYNYNLMNGNLAYNGASQSAATWQAAGRDVNGLLGVAPTFVSSSDLHLATASQGIGAGNNLSGTFTTDQAGTTRTVPWDMGAYKYASVISTSASSFSGKAGLTGKASIK